MSDHPEMIQEITDPGSRRPPDGYLISGGSSPM